MSYEKRTLADLQMKQALPLSVKIIMTKARIREWVNTYGEDGGLGFKDVIDWINENGNMHIMY